jgi:hypothetical protein
MAEVVPIRAAACGRPPWPEPVASLQPEWPKCRSLPSSLAWRAAAPTTGSRLNVPAARDGTDGFCEGNAADPTCGIIAANGRVHIDAVDRRSRS